MDTAIR